ncbi:MAG: hypothetical protein QM532_01315 [Cyanobium sp. MAG06]|nr:hypothetical protein [Cyanobium sp. MAG06]
MTDHNIANNNNSRYDFVYKTFIVIDYILNNYKEQYVNNNSQINVSILDRTQSYILENLFFSKESYNNINYLLFLIDNIYNQFKIIENRQIINNNNINLILSYINKCKSKLLEEHTIISNKINSKVNSNIQGRVADMEEMYLSNNQLDNIQANSVASLLTQKDIIKDISNNTNNISKEQIAITDKNINNNIVSKTDDNKTKDISQILNDPKKAKIINTNRREQIYSVLLIGDVGIKDISKKVKGCSEKTILREIEVLIDNNLVYKTGERR